MTNENDGACGSVTSAENCILRYAMMSFFVSSRTVRLCALRPSASAGSDESADELYVAAIVASAGMVLPLAGSAAAAEAPPGSDGSATGTVAAPGAAAGIATAALAEKLCGARAGAFV